MTAADDRDALAKAMSHDHRRWGGTFSRCKRCGEEWPCDARKVADYALDLAARDRRVAAEALRRAADHLPLSKCRLQTCFREDGDHLAPSECLKIDGWLRDRADGIEAQG